MTNLTPRQLAIISEYNLGKNRNVSLELSLHADLVLLMEDNPDRFNSNFSQVIREACYCYLYFGIDWREKKAGDDLRQIIREEMSRVKFVEASENVVKDGKMDDSEGFFN